MHRDDFVLVSGSDSSHFNSLCQFLESATQHEPRSRLVVFDLGLTDEECRHLSKTFPRIDIRHFDFSKYPEYFNIQVAAGEYAWKPVILSDMMNEFQTRVCWMDAGNVITKPLRWMRKFINKIGIYTPHSSGTIGDWTHPKTLNYMQASEALLDKKNVTGGCVAIDYRHAHARAIVEQWKRYALIKECIAPEGSNRQNHRQDQAVLSILAHQMGLASAMPIRRYGFLTHQDID